MEFTPAQLLARLREGTVPPAAKAALARGALPLPPAPLIEALDILAGDADPGLRDEALESLARLPASIVRSVASAPASAPGLLDSIARRYSENEAVALELARNGAVADETAAFLAGLPLPGVLEVIGRSQDRLERAPEIVAALLRNPETPIAVVRLWQEHEQRSGVAESGAAAASVAEEAEGDRQVFDGVLTEEVEEDPVAQPAEETALSARQISIHQLIKRLSMGQKVALAVKGNREVRNILVRDTNRMICLKVLENPRISDTDVEAFAKGTNLSEDVLRGIANRKEWCKKYAVVKALVFNPKAPLGVTLELLKRLTLKDVEGLAKNRNVPETLRSAARRLHALKRDGAR